MGSDADTDLALLKVESDEPLVAASWGRSDETRIGDWVMAIGNPFGLGGSVTAGIVSARQRDINAGRYDDFIQTDAAINRGNSGGPMFNLDGDVIGVNTAIFSPSGGSVGIGFAIPSNLASNIIRQLREFGEVRRGWLGVRIQTVNEELAEGLRLDEPRGALVASVTTDGPAEKGGIKQGDVILEFNGRPVEEMRKLPRMVAETPIGEEVDVVVWRKGQEETFQVMLGELDVEQIAAAEAPEEEPIEDGAVPSLGLELGTITPELRERFELGDSTNGVVVTAVDPDGSAAEEGLDPRRCDRRGGPGRGDAPRRCRRQGPGGPEGRLSGGHPVGLSPGRFPLGLRCASTRADLRVLLRRASRRLDEVGPPIAL